MKSISSRNTDSRSLIVIKEVAYVDSSVIILAFILGGICGMILLAVIAIAAAHGCMNDEPPKSKEEWKEVD